ncbi:MAG: hypothetical protein RI549_08120 [Wenzhouxiangella sp.]|nr:hypothetical protein [Wenzhouxiangella sp.]
MLDLDKNLLTTALIGASGVFGLVGLIFIGVYFLTDVRFIGPAPDQALELSLVEAPDTGLDELGAYSAIVERPVFFPDRQLPVMEVEVAQDESSDEAPEPEIDPIDPLQAVVAGIIIAPDYRVALVNDQVADDVVIMREGMSFEGDQAPWQLAEIGPERVRFVSSDGQETDLALKVYTEGLAMGSSNRRADGGDGGDDGETADDPQSRADLIRQRVAERRAELRARAERQAAQQQAAQEPTPESEQTQQQPQS